MDKDAAALNAKPANGAPKVPTEAVADASVPASGGALSQTMTLPGSASDVSADSSKVASPVVLTTPAVPAQPDVVVPAVAVAPVQVGAVVPTAAGAVVPATAGAVVPDATGVALPAEAGAGAVVPVAATIPATTIPLGAAGVVNAEINKFVFHSPKERARYEMAAARFPDFCHDWQRMLHDRETNNLEHLTWQTRDGAETSTYTGYGQVETCETKESVEGVPIGKISYEEMIYYLAGKNEDEARHATPKLIHQTHTLEIFSWEKDKWFY